MRHPYIDNFSIAITLTHTDDLVIAITYAPSILIGVDLEGNKKNLNIEFDKIMEGVIFDTGIKNMQFNKGLAWVAMKALTKAIRTGFQ